jgi:ABC-type lipoprotein release transport system permease subunit
MYLISITRISRIWIGFKQKIPLGRYLAQSRQVGLGEEARRYAMQAQTGIGPWWAVLTVWGIVNMGLPMFRQDRRLWLVTVATTVLLLGSMGFAIHKGVG